MWIPYKLHSNSFQMHVKVILSSFQITFKSISKSSHVRCNLLSDSIQVLIRFRSNSFFNLCHVLKLHSSIIRFPFTFPSSSLQNAPWSLYIWNLYGIVCKSNRKLAWGIHGPFPYGNLKKFLAKSIGNLYGNLIVNVHMETFRN